MAKTTVFVCSVCGQRYNITPEGDFREFGMSRRWQAEIVQSIPKTAERPQDPSLLLRFVNLPLQLSIISGLFASLILSGVISGIIKLLEMAKFLEWKLTVWDIAYIFVGCAIFVSGIVWFAMLFIDKLTLLLNEIVEVLERIFGVDINKDGAIGRKQEQEWVQTEILDRDKRQMKRVKFPFPNDKLREVAAAILYDQSEFSRRGLSNCLSETQFRNLQQEMLDRGLCYWKNAEQHNLGVALSPGGKAFLRGYLPK